jgi:ATPase subunit of ABC transporter with duplicated ATPase domains
LSSAKNSARFSAEAFENQQSMIAKNEDFIRRNIAGQKTKLAKSRRNMLERIERVEAVARPLAGKFHVKENRARRKSGFNRRKT